jgi:hypothetical protein
MLARKFRRRLGYACNLDEPTTIHEKMQYRKVFGNHAFYAMIADKYLVRDYIKEKVGSQYLVPLLAAVDRLTPELFRNLPDSFIIKANHGCKWHKIVRDKSQLDISATVRYFDRLRAKKWGRRNGEYHYSLIQPKIVIEKLLLSFGDLPCDYSFYCHHSQNGFEFMLGVSYSDPPVFVHFDDAWNLQDGDLTPLFLQRYYRPDNFDDMVHIAKTLSSDFDFIRVDMYNIDGRIYCGELTLTPGGGMKPIQNENRLAKRSRMWKLDADNELLYRRRTAA